MRANWLPQFCKTNKNTLQQRSVEFEIGGDGVALV